MKAYSVLILPLAVFLPACSQQEPATPAASVKPMLEILAPAQGEEVERGKEFTIRWKSENLSEPVTVQWRGASDTDDWKLTSGDAERNDSRPFVIPRGWQSETYLVRVQTADGATVDTCEFRSPKPYIKVLLPNGGEKFGREKPFEIRWESQGIGDQVRIRVQAGGNDHPAPGELTENDGAHTYTLPLNWGYKEFKVWVTSVDGAIADSSDDYFHSEIPVLELIHRAQMAQMLSGKPAQGTLREITKNPATLSSVGKLGDDTPVLPRGRMILNDDTLYGVAEEGPVGQGTSVLYAIKTDGTTFRVLHRFTGARFGVNPELTLVEDRLYGTTFHKGGSIFGINTDGSEFQVLHSFSEAPDNGLAPRGRLAIQGNTVYGVTMDGGGGADPGGTVYAINTDGTDFRPLHSLDFETDFENGCAPYLLVGADDVLYGVTEFEGKFGHGGVFAIGVDGENFRVVHHFEERTRWNDVVLHESSLLAVGEINRNLDGCLESLDLKSGKLQVLYPFRQFDGSRPRAITIHGDALYGVTEGGGAENCGAIFSVRTDGSSFQLLHSLTRESGFPPNGATIVGSTMYDATAFYVSKEQGPGQEGRLFSLEIPAQLLSRTDPPTTGKGEPLPADVVRAWEQAGAKIGRMSMRNSDGLGFWSRPVILDGWLPAFKVEDWKDGALSGLPDPGRPFALYAVRTDVTDSQLKELAGFENLQLLNLESTPLTDSGLKDLARIKSLKLLNLSSTKITDDGLDALATLEQLESLHLRNTQVTGAGLGELARLKHLQLLNLGSTQLVDSELEDIGDLKGLTLLNVGGTKITDVSLAHVVSLKGLQTLHVGGTQVTDSGLKELAGLEELQVLWLGRTQITDSGLKELAPLKNLKSLSLSSTQVTDVGLNHVVEQHDLQKLYLSNTQVTDAGMTSIARFKNLQELQLNNTQVSGAGIAELVGLDNLHTLNLYGTQVSDEGLKHLAKLKGLRHLDLARTQVTDEGVEKLRGESSAWTIRHSVSTSHNTIGTCTYLEVTKCPKHLW